MRAMNTFSKFEFACIYGQGESWYDVVAGGKHILFFFWAIVNIYYKENVEKLDIKKLKKEVMSFASPPPPVKKGSYMILVKLLLSLWLRTSKELLRPRMLSRASSVRLNQKNSNCLSKFIMQMTNDLVRGEDLDELLRVEALGEAIDTSRRIVVDGWPLIDFELRNFLLRGNLTRVERSYNQLRFRMINPLAEPSSPVVEPSDMENP
ncbi:uncharacterized protein EV154DRAFT_534435 [Mucor mucedo]|uniref:uncharacterized protein n=1 Tax=Mucor mucedo TaxID=29922 RepID=UPI00221F4686|nr:uncharacterized protein EV154DRAFT_534435 [Mucor mucedo]KAI7863925.1 hypothetical protein EV154DRAFT_534435 [Mucor mucedo]